MSPRYEKYYTTSEFAKLCHVTKDTLFHYDTVGIFKPEFVNEKGYRHYTIEQFFAFDIITTLKKAEMSLAEIKEYMENKDPEQFLDLLEKKEKYLKDEQIKLECMSQFLKNTAATIRCGLEAVHGKPRLEDHEETFLAAVKLNRQESEKECLTKVSELHQYCMSNGPINTLPTGIISNKESLENDNSGLLNKAKYFCCKIDFPCSNEWLYIKPKGKYAVIDHKGTYESIPRSYQILKNFISSEHLSIIGNIYEFEYLGISAGSPENNVLNIAVQVK